MKFGIDLTETDPPAHRGADHRRSSAASCGRNCRDAPGANERQVNAQEDFAQQSQLTLAFTQKDMEYKTNAVSTKSALMKFGPGAVVCSGKGRDHGLYQQVAG